jgi:hypothetical protein
MTTITDVSPNGSNTAATDINHSVIGRMLSIGCTPDGQTIFAGSYSNLWSSTDGGQTWGQLTWPQPDWDQFSAPGSLGGWCVTDIASCLGWRVEKHPRFLAQLRRPHFRRRTPLDIVGFGDCGVWTSLGNGDGTFQPPRVVIDNLGYDAGGWRVDLHPRFVVDLNGDNCADLVGFGYAGVWTAIGNGDGTFQTPQLVLQNFGLAQDWRVDRHPRFLAHLTNSGYADIVGFGEDGVWVALGNGDGTFRESLTNPVLANFSPAQNWRVDRHPRFLAHLTSSGFADIVGFGTDGVFVVLGNGDGTFREPHANPVLQRFGYAQGWRVDQHPRIMAKLTPSGFDDIVGFFQDGVHTATSNGDGTFKLTTPELVLENFGVHQGWKVDEHPRFAVDLTGNGCADIVGFGDAGVWTALNEGEGRFGNANFVLENMGVEQGWRVDRHPRFAAPLLSGGVADLVGCGDAGVWTAMNDGAGDFPSSNFVLPNFGYGTIVLALACNDRIVGGRGIWRSPDGGASWTLAHQFATPQNVGQLVWALGSDHLVYAAGGASLAISGNAGTTFEDVYPWGQNAANQVNHVAVWQNEPADPAPAVIYVLGDSVMTLSFDGGRTWIADKGSVPSGVGGATSPIANSNTPTVMVISPGFILEVIVAQNGSSAGVGAMLFRGDYSSFPLGAQTSTWTPVPLPDQLTDPTTQDSGNVLLATTQRGRGELLYYGAQRPFLFVGPLFPTSGADWKRLDTNVHFDLHGVLLSPDFEAVLVDGVYRPVAGSMWLLADGGIYFSTNAGLTFNKAQDAMTLSCVNIAGVSHQGQGPALSFNCGDNDGFYSMDGGQTWTYQDYGGGDNDCSFADPLRPSSMLVFTPRWNLVGSTADGTRNSQTVAVYEAPAGSLPNAKALTPMRHIVPGPPLLPPSATYHDLWNAGSFYGSRGSRPIVLGLPGETAPAEGDYAFILNPATAPQLVRTQNILDIAARSEWMTTATGPGQGANVFLQGPPLPNAGLGVVQAAGGHAATVFFVGGDGGSTLWTWKAGQSNWTMIVPAPAAGASVAVNVAVRFFVSPYQPNLIYILDSDHVKRSEDGGATWTVDANLEAQLTWGGQIALSTNDGTSGLGDHFDLILTDMQFDPNNPRTRFAVGEGGVFLTIDGVTWTRLLHTGAMAGRPTNCYFDWISDPFDPALYVGFAGRSIVKLTDIPLTIIQ